METYLFVDYIRKRVKSRKDKPDISEMHSLVRKMSNSMEDIEKMKSGKEIYSFLCWKSSCRDVHTLESFRISYYCFCRIKNFKHEIIM